MEYRFHLQKGSALNKISCPQCNGHKCFRRYVDDEGIVEFPNHVGRCDHENHCGYHYTPKMFFSDNPEARPKEDDANYSNANTTQFKPTFAPLKATEPSFISEDIMRKSFACYNKNKLFGFLSKHFSKENTLTLFQKYNVGSSRHWDGAVVFWQVDISGKVRTGKVMAYGDNGHRVKDPVSLITWAHSLLRIPDYNLHQCLFGEHLLNKEPDKQVAIVESEKTAIIGAFYLPQFLWLATGGKGTCWNEETLNVLHGRQVILFPDLKATESWEAKVPMLQAVGADAHVFGGLELNATEEEREAGLDIGDYLIRVNGAEAVLQQLLDTFPALQILMAGLDLELVGFAPS